ncbi:hypothetical protein LTR17_021007 [Elasticomyces elasticus]|nr:hypothetical protein LTR17_021007 [Elasticomyces elasticus]
MAPKKACFPCPNGCTLKFFTSADANAHSLKKCAKKTVRFPCPLSCGKDFGSSYYAKKHAEGACSKAKGKAGAKAGDKQIGGAGDTGVDEEHSEDAQSSDDEDAMSGVEGEDVEAVPCPLGCGGTYASQEKANRHSKRHCKYKTVNNSRTKYDIKELENGQFLCPLGCGEVYDTRSKATRHATKYCKNRADEEKEKVAKDLKKPCPLGCGKLFSRSDAAKRHAEQDCRNRTDQQRNAAKPALAARKQLSKIKPCERCGTLIRASSKKHDVLCKELRERFLAKIGATKLRRTFKPHPASRDISKRAKKLTANQLAQQLQSHYMDMAVIRGVQGHPGAHFQQASVRGDGNCLLRSLAHLLYGNQNDWARVRRTIRQHYEQATGRGTVANPALNQLRGQLYARIQQESRTNAGPATNRQNTDLESQLFGAGDGYWATEDMVQIAADALNAEVFVHTLTFPNGQPTWNMIVRGDPGAAQLHLVNYLGLNHWQPMTPMNAAFRFTAPVDAALRDPLAGFTIANGGVPAAPPPIPQQARLPAAAGLGQIGSGVGGEGGQPLDSVEEHDDDIPASLAGVKVPNRLTRSGIFPQMPHQWRIDNVRQMRPGWNSGDELLELDQDSNPARHVQISGSRILDFNFFARGQTKSQREEYERQALLRRQMWSSDPRSEDPQEFQADFKMLDDAVITTNTGEITFIDPTAKGGYSVVSKKFNAWGKGTWEKHEPFEEYGIVQAEGPQQPVFFPIGRFSDFRELDQVAQALETHDIVLQDYFAVRQAERTINPAFPLLPFPQQVVRLWINNWSADNMIPVRDSPYVLPEYLQLQDQLDLLAAQPAAIAPPVYLFSRSISGVSVARTYRRIRARWPGLRIYIVFALRKHFVDAVSTDLQHLRLLNNGIESNNGMFYTHEIDLTDLANAEAGVANADGASVELLQLFQEESDARNGGMDWDTACATVWSRGFDRNGFS